MYTKEDISYAMDDKVKAAYALNLCTVSISQIIDYDDINILEQEYNSILNNLNLEQFPKDEPLLDVLKGILDTINFYRISEGDRKLVDLEYQQRMKSAIWSSIPSVGAIFATSNPIALGLTLATQVGIGYMNYRRNRAEYQLSREKAEWQLESGLMRQLNGLRQTLFETSWRLAEEYNFPDEYRLTDQQIDEYNKILMDTNSLKRFNKLNFIKDKFSAYPPFWYQIGSTANSIYRDESLGLDPDTREIFRKHAIDYFEKYAELNRFNLLRHDILTSSWALEYVDLLDLTCDDGKCKARDLVTVAERYSGNSNDVLELCAYAYLKLSDYENAARVFNILVNNGYNVSVNAKVLSAIYIQKTRQAETQESAMRDYKMLKLIVDSKYMIPMPESNVDWEKWAPEWEEKNSASQESTAPKPKNFDSLMRLIGSRHAIPDGDQAMAEKKEGNTAQMPYG